MISITRKMDNHRPKTKTWKLWVFLIGIVILTPLVVFETYLRLTTTLTDLNSGLTYSTELTELSQKYSFLERYADRGGSSLEYDSYLGWDANIKHNRIRGGFTSLNADRLNGEDRIITIGDSFTYGAQVKHEQSFPSVLESRINGAEVLNMAVPGYGLDQAVLKYLRYGEQFFPDILIFGVHTHDYFRNRLAFFTAPKPIFRYRQETDEIHLVNSNLRTPEQNYERLKKQLGGPTLYSYAFARKSFLLAYWKRTFPNVQQDYHDTSKKIVEHLFSLLLDSLKATNTLLLVIQIPHSYRFSGDTALSQSYNQWERKNLIKVYEKLGIPFMDLLLVFAENYNRKTVIEDFYLKSANFTGHLSVEGNEVVAKHILNKLLELNWLRSNGSKLELTRLDPGDGEKNKNFKDPFWPNRKGPKEALEGQSDLWGSNS